MIDLPSLIRDAAEIAPFPASMVKLAQMVARPDCDLVQVGDLVAYDPGLTVKLLRAANATVNAGAMRVTSVREALARLGMAQVLSLSVASSARTHLVSAVPAFDLAEGRLWRHSVAAAVATETIPAFCPVEVPPEAFTAALLHDVGKVVMGPHLRGEVLRFMSLARESGRLSPLEAEIEILGVHHGELGGLVAQRWELPPRIVTGIIHHHDPTVGGDLVCDLTFLANQVAKRVEATLDGATFELMLPGDVADRLGINLQKVEELCPVAASRFAQLSRRYDAV